MEEVVSCQHDIVERSLASDMWGWGSGPKNSQSDLGVWCPLSLASVFTPVKGEDGGLETTVS